MRIGSLLAATMGLFSAMGMSAHSTDLSRRDEGKWTQKKRYVPFECDGAAHFSKAEAKRARKAEKLKRDMAKGVK